MRKSIRDRLLAKIDIDAGSDCWVWNGATYPKGYGRLQIGGTNRRAHRVAYSTFKHTIPPDMCVCHSCDNRLCINPDHLFLGTPAENNADRDAKGRQARGSRNGRSKLTPSDVEIIRSSAEVPRQRLAAAFGVTPQHISSIRRGETWT